MGMQRWQTNNGVSALAGGGQTGATLLQPQSLNRVTTVATTADSVMLPGAINGSMCYVKNATSNSMNVFPQGGEFINALAVNAAFAVVAGKSVEFLCVLDGTWESHLSA